MTEYSPSTSTNQKHGQSKNLPKSAKIAILSVVGVVSLGLSFLGGIQFQKGKSTLTTATVGQSGQYGTMNGQMMGPGGNGVRMRGNFGEVTAVSSTSITYKNSNDESKTFTINSDTKITNDGATATTDDIAVGDTVIISENTSDASVAARIVINPTMGNAPTNAQINTN